MGRIIIFTGKGGVGKTSVAAAHALSSARDGIKTILVSTDMAHNIGDAFDVVLGDEITPIEENLSLLEINPYKLMRDNFPEIKKNASELFSSARVALDSMSVNFVIPGFENLFSLLKIKELYESDAFERIIVDCAPTAETLSLLKIPELLSWYMEKFYPIGKTAIRVLSPISKLKYDVKMPDKKTLNAIENIHLSLIDLQELLKNHDICSLRLVCIPEKMVVEETKRNYMYMRLYKYHVDRVFINRILPDTDNAFIKKIQDNQKIYLKQLEDVFYNVPIRKAPWYNSEIKGSIAIERLIKDIIDSSSFDVIDSTNTESYEKCDDGYILDINIPNINSDSMSISHFGTDLNIKINNINRIIPLPNILKNSRLDSSTVNSDGVRIHFILEKETEE